LNTALNKKLKYGLLIIGTTLTLVIGFVGYGLYLMEIEDHYGDLQELFYASKDGDLIVNKTTSEFGIIEKNWKRIKVNNSKDEPIDLYNWVYKNGVETNSEIYRPSKKLIFENLTINELTNLIESKNLKFIIRN
jgi:hypothetical protein